MSGTVTVEEIVSGPVKRITFSWTSNSSGQASGDTVYSYDGDVTAVALIPGSGGSQPTNNYDVTITDSASVDILGGNGANNSNTTDHNLTASQISALSSFTAGILTLNVTNAGDTKSGTVIFYIFGTTNTYCTLEQVRTRLALDGTDITDDSVVTDMIEQASRAMESLCGGRVFYKFSATRYYDVPGSRQLDLDNDLLAVTTLTNGNGDVISASDYLLYDRNDPPYYAIRLKESTGTTWEADGADTEQVISLAGYWGYVDRTATDPRSQTIIKSTEDICLAIVTNAYKKRYGLNATGTATITAAGVVITPDDIPALQRRQLQALARNY